MPYAIRNRRTKKFVTGTDYRYFPPHQITSTDSAYIYEDEECAIHGKNIRGCGKDYEIVPVMIEVIQNE
jgi:hypothetical protein